MVAISFVDYLDEHIGISKDIGYERIYRCPFCQRSDDYKLYVKTKFGETELWNCKRCKSVGNPVSFVMKYEGISYGEALNTLELYGLDDKPLAQIMEQDNSLTEEEALYLLLKGFKTHSDDKVVHKKPPKPPTGYKRLLDNYRNPEALPFLKYLLGRRVNADDIRTHDIGYIVKGTMTTDSGKDVVIRNHIVFLTKDFSGNYLYWNTRSIDKDAYIKTFNAPSKDDEYGKSDVFFNLNNAYNKPFIVIAEGVFDAMTIPNNSGIASFGKALSIRQIDLLLSVIQPEQKVYLFLDDDAIDSTVEVSHKLAEKHKNTFIVLNGTGADINELGSEKAMAFIMERATRADGQGELLAQLNLL